MKNLTAMLLVMFGAQAASASNPELILNCRFDDEDRTFEIILQLDEKLIYFGGRAFKVSAETRDWIVAVRLPQYEPDKGDVQVISLNEKTGEMILAGFPNMSGAAIFNGSCFKPLR